MLHSGSEAPPDAVERYESGERISDIGCPACVQTVLDEEGVRRDRSPVPRSKLLRELRDLADEHGRVSRSVYEEHGEHSVSTVGRRFGRWSDAKRLAVGGDCPDGWRTGAPGGGHSSGRVGEAEALRQVRESGAEQWKDFGGGDHGRHLPRRRFGSWEEARRLAVGDECPPGWRR